MSLMSPKNVLRTLRLLRLLRLLRVAKLQQALTLLANRFLSAHAFMVMKVVAGWEMREELEGKIWENMGENGYLS